jgi:predicted TIM-barrel fold metal-dependent hydrolase
MSASTDVQAEVRKLRAKLDHPVVDGDGHVIESMGTFYRYLAQVGGDDAPERYREELKRRPTSSRGNRERGDPRGAWWAVTNDARDLATVMFPKLLYERMDELGLDFAILYPSLGLTLHSIQDEKVRRNALRALNTMNHELTAPYQDRMTAVAMIPMHTPEEALEEIEYVSEKLGMKVVVMPAGVGRPIPALERDHPEAFPCAAYFDCYGYESFYDYSPVWESFRKHKLAVTSHGAPALHYMPQARRSASNYMYNHIFGHAYQQIELCLSLVMGGVPKRFPDLNFGFLEGGAGWAADLLHSLEEHYEKRNAEGIQAFDPAKLDRALLGELFTQYAPETFAFDGERRETERSRNGPRDYSQYDEFEASLLEDEEDLVDMFGRQFYFGCEADDMSVYRALDAKGNPMGVRLQPFFSSDIGHWDVPHISEVLLESHQLVDKGLLSDADYRDFVFTYPAGLHLGMNPHFFDGTPVESAAKELAKARAAS